MHVEGQKSTLNDIPHMSVILFYETESLTDLEITK